MDYNNKNVRRQDRLLDEDSAMQILSSAEYGVLSMCGLDGQPYGLPLNFVWDGKDCIYFHCASQGRKLTVIGENAKVSFCVVGKVQLQPERFTTLYQSIVLTGEANLVDSDEERWKAIRLILEKLSPAHIDEGIRQSQKSYARVAILRMRIQHISGKAKPQRG